MKKTLALLLAVVLALGLGMTGAAASRSKITGVDAVGLTGAFGDAWDFGDIDLQSWKAENPLVNSFYNETFQFTDKGELFIPLYSSCFTWDDGAPGSGITMPDIRSGRVKAHLQVSSGKKWIEGVSIGTYKGKILKAYLTAETLAYYQANYAYLGYSSFEELCEAGGFLHDSKGYYWLWDPGRMPSVKIDLADYIASTGDNELDFTLYFSVDGKRTDGDWSFQFTGNLINRVNELDSDTDYFDLHEGVVAEATEYNKGLEWFVGHNLSVFGHAISGKKYYGALRDLPGEEFDRLLKANPDVDSAYRLHYVGLSSTAQYAMFDGLGDTFWVYGLPTASSGGFESGTDLIYLGKSDEKLPFNAMYVLANRDLGAEISY